MKILITGGCGFIGAKLVEYLSARQGWEIVVIDSLSAQVHGTLCDTAQNLENNPHVHVVKGDVRDKALLSSLMKGTSAVVHLAAETGTAQSMYEIERYNSVNCGGTAILLECLAEQQVRAKTFVLASSRAIYGDGGYICRRDGMVYPPGRTLQQLGQKQWDPVCPKCGGEIHAVATPESARGNPASIYAATKYAQEHLVRIAGEALGIRTAILRFQNVYGAGQSLNNPYTGILSIFSTRIRKGSSLPIFEDGKESRDFVHVKDVVNAIGMAIETKNPNNMTLNVGSGRATSVMEIATMLVGLLGGQQSPHITGQFRVGDIRHCFADLTEIKRLLGYVPQVTMEEGLKEFVGWVKTQPLPEDGLDAANRELMRRNLLT